jgi:hypothetical protein
MKICNLIAIGFLLSTAPIFSANSDVGAAIMKQFGEAQLSNVILVSAVSNPTDPVQWRVYSRDPYRPGELLLTVANRGASGTWETTPAGAGRLLPRVPPQRIDFKRLKVDAKEARRIASETAKLAKQSFFQVSYQLAANEVNATPEWGLVMETSSGTEVGFIVISAETGAVIHQDWTPDPSLPPTTGQTASEKQGEAAAKKVKQGMRKAWDWTEDAGRKTGGFFRELFR